MSPNPTTLAADDADGLPAFDSLKDDLVRKVRGDLSYMATVRRLRAVEALLERLPVEDILDYLDD